MALISFSWARLVQTARGFLPDATDTPHFLIVRSAPPVSMNFGGSFSVAAFEPSWGF